MSSSDKCAIAIFAIIALGVVTMTAIIGYVDVREAQCKAGVAECGQ